MKRFYFLFWKSNCKLLSNCNRNFRGHPSGWISWWFLPCRVCTYWEPIKQKLDKTRSSPIIMLLYWVWYCCRFQVPQIKNFVFWQRRHHGMPYLSHTLDRYEPYVDRDLIYRHMVNFCINCVLVFHLFYIRLFSS